MFLSVFLWYIMEWNCGGCQQANKWGEVRENDWVAVSGVVFLSRFGREVCSGNRHGSGLSSGGSGGGGMRGFTTRSRWAVAPTTAAVCRRAFVMEPCGEMRMHRAV